MATPRAARRRTRARPLRADAERNRRRILAAARDVFAERGLDATMDEIARRAGVGVGTAYRRFANREELIEALFDERIEQFVALAEDALGKPDPWAGLVAFLERSVALQAADRGLKELLMSDARGRVRVARARAHIVPLLAQVVERARAAGAVRADLDHMDVALVNIMLGAVADLAHDVQPELWRRYLALVLDGMRARPAEATALPVGPLDEAGLEQALAACGPRRR